MKYLDAVANAILVIFGCCFLVCIITFPAGPNDWPPVVYVGIAAYTIIKYAFFAAVLVAIPLKVVAYIIQKSPDKNR